MDAALLLHRLVRAGDGLGVGPARRSRAATVARGARPEGGQRVKVTRCSFREPQLEPYTCTYVLAMLPPQSTQWPLP